MTGDTLRVAVTGDDEVFMAGVVSIATRSAGLEIDAIVPPALLPTALAELDADLVLLVASSDGYASRDWLAEVPSHLPTILISPHSEGEVIREAFDRGAAGFLSPKVCAAELIRAIRSVAVGGEYVESKLVRSLLVDTASEVHGVQPQLTSRQTEVLGLVASGLENKQIARRLGIAEGTVKSHLRVVYSRLGATGRAEAVAAAFRLGLLD